MWFLYDIHTMKKSNIVINSGEFVNQVEQHPSIEPDDQRITDLGDKLRDSGNGVVEEISELNNGEWTDEWIKTAEIANRLTQDYDLGN